MLVLHKSNEVFNVKKIVLLVSLLMVILGSVAFAADSDQYLWLYSTDKVGYYLDTQSITYKINSDKTLDKNIVTIYSKAVFNDEGRQAVTDRLTEKNLDTTKAQQINYLIAKIEYNCTSQKYIPVYSYIYDLDNELISRKVYDKSSSLDIVPGSTDDKLFKPILAYIHTHDKEITAATQANP
jgi:hypothetical protein